MSKSKEISSKAFQAGCSPVCDVVRKPKRRKRKSRPLHRVLGMLAALPLLWVLATGVVLNHSDDFGLERKTVIAPWILSAYGMTPKGEAQAVRIQSHTVTEWDGVVFFDEQQIDLQGDLITAVALQDSVALVTKEAVVRINFHGEVIEKVDELSLPGTPITAAGTQQGALALLVDGVWYVTGEDWIEFQQIESPENRVSMGKLEDGELKDILMTKWSGGGLPMSRLVLDLHAGHFLGPIAAYFYDIVAACTVWLIGTGVVLQIRNSRRNRAK